MPTSRPRRLVGALLAAAAVAAGGTTAVPAPAAAAPPHFTDVSMLGTFHNISQVDPRWAPLVMAGDKPIGNCGCQISALASMLGMFTGRPAVRNHRPGFSEPLFASTIVDRTWQPFDSVWRRRWILATHLEPIFSPHYLDVHLRNGGLYDEGGGCGAPPKPYALEWVANPSTMPLPGGRQLPLGPTGLTVDYIDGFATDIVDRNLAMGRPTIVGRQIPKPEGGFRYHVNIVTGYQPEVGRYRWVDPVAETGAWGTTLWGIDEDTNAAYADWESTIVTTLDVHAVMKPLQHFVLDPFLPETQLQATADDAAGEASIELGAVLADGTPVGFDPTTGEHHQFHGHFDYRTHPTTPIDDPDAAMDPDDPIQGLVTTDVEPGTLRSRIVATSAGRYSVRLQDVRAGGLDEETLAVATGIADAGEEIKHEVTYGADGSAVAVEVDDFSPEVVVATIAGTAGEPVELDASGSFDADGTIESTVWDFGDGTTGTGATPTHTWAKPGAYPVTVTVTSDNGVTRTETVEAAIAPTETDRPDVVIDLAPDVADGGWTDADQVEITATATDDGSGVESVSLHLEGPDGQRTETADDDTVTAVVDAEGRTTVDASATDRMDNGAVAEMRTIGIDRTGPTAEVRTPAPGRPVRTLGFVAGTAADAHSGVAAVDVQLTRVDGRAWDGDAWIDGPAWLDADGATAWWLTTGLPTGADLPDGTYTVRARATDVAGNVGAAGPPTAVTVAPDATGGGAEVIELPPPLADTSSVATAIDDAGLAYGYLDDLNLRDHGLRWDADGTTTELAPLPGHTGAHLAGASPGGVAVGWSENATGQPRATAWVDGRPVDLGTANGGISDANDANDAGVVVGSSAVEPGRQRVRAARFELDGDARFLPDLGGASIAFGVNQAGTAVGYAYPGTSSIHRPFVTDGTTATDLGTPGQFGAAYDINDAGDVVGFDGEDAVLWPDGGRGGPGERVVLGQGTARSVDAAGERVVGTREQTAMLWEDGDAIALDDLVDPAAGWQLHDANAIDDAGRVVVGVGTHLGQRRGFRLVLPGDDGGGGDDDTTAPTTTATITPIDAATGWVDEPVEVTLTAGDGDGVGVARIEVAGQPTHPGAGRTITVTEDGTHHLAWSAVDLAGNVEVPPGTATVRVDTTAPTAEVEVPTPASGWHRGFAVVDLDGTDGTAGSGLADLAVTVDGAPATHGGARPVVVAGDGSHTLTVVPTDVAGNVGEPVTRILTVDGTGPTIDIAAEPGHPLAFAVDDTGSGVAEIHAWVTDSAGRRAVEAGEPLVRPGVNHVEVRATDVAGNLAVATLDVLVEDPGPIEEPTANQRPVAHAGGPYAAAVDQVVTLDGRASTDADGDDLTYTWYVDGGLLDTGPTVQVALVEPGVHRVRLVVHDGRDGSLVTAHSATTLTVTERTRTTLTAAPVVLRLQSLTVYLGTFEARLTDGTGAPVAGEPVAFGVLGSTRCTATTNANGVARCQARLLDALLAVLFPYTATYAGDEARLPSRTQARLLR